MSLPQTDSPPVDESVYSRESMLREVLGLRLTEWLDSKTFFVSELPAMRDIARSIQGLPESWPIERLPLDIDVLGGVRFDALSGMNLFQSVVASLEYVGVTEQTGAGLLGPEKWAEISRRVSALKGSSVGGATMASSWSQLTLASLAGEVFGGRNFSICDVDQLSSALEKARSAMGLPAHKGNQVTYAALRSLHCKDWTRIDPAVCAGIKDAVWDVCGVDDLVGPVAFGEHWDRVRVLSAPDGTGRSVTVDSPALSMSHAESADEVAQPVTQRKAAAKGWVRRLFQS